MTPDEHSEKGNKMRIDLDTPVDVLMHAVDIRYVDLNADEVMHWKYIKKKKLDNGKWRYYYHDDNYENVRKKYIDANQRNLETSARFKKYMSFVDSYTTALDKVNGGNKALTDADENLQGWKEMRDKAGDESAAAYRELKRIKPQYEYVQRQYIRSAGHKVADFLNEASDKIYKAKKWFKSLF